MRTHPSLKDRLVNAARRWASASEAPLSRLGKRVAGDANFFDRLSCGGGLQLGTLEKFARFLVDAGNWPEGVAVPDEVIAFGHAVGVSAPAAGLSAGEARGISPPAREQAA